MSWKTGQRVRNEVEPALGVGSILKLVGNRQLEVGFPAAGETRRYNLETAPLRRVVLGTGQRAMGRDGQSFIVEQVDTHEGLYVYRGQGVTLNEAELADHTSSSGPLERLAAGEVSHFTDYELRRKGWALRQSLLGTRTRGLAGARVMLLGHQLAIAHRVASRELPRVLLADEVGLGKTIEASLIFSILKAQGRAERVLVLTPPSLVHQWLSELYRRFNELFRVLSAPGEDEEDGEPFADPFEDATRVIAPLDLMLDPEYLEAAMGREWDLLIVDEAHHLRWSEHDPSPEYRIVQALAARSKGLLLLTATPLKEGLETEFALLHLVDPQRFNTLPAFVKERSHLKEVAVLAQRLQAGEAVAGELKALFPDDDGLHAVLDAGDVDRALRELVDRHGTGRVLVRNRREKLGGFPGRRITPVPLPHFEGKLGPGDPRLAWLFDLVRADRTRKILVMAADVRTVRVLEKAFREDTGIALAVFHENLPLVERDRQAAYFQEEPGAQVLLSSEIGGEGRNFQFCHHLVLFDLPRHPDALEQRIGRLDRIGQDRTIDVYAPYLEGTPQEALFRWHLALGTFDAPVSGADHLMGTVGPDLEACLKVYPKKEELLAQLISRSLSVLADHREKVQQSADFLVDLNSYDPELGEALAAEIVALDPTALAEGIGDLLDRFGIHEEELSQPGVRRIRAGDLMEIEPFPGLREGGYLGTYDRKLALEREEMQFLSPDHPLVEGALAMYLDQDYGRASLAIAEGSQGTVAMQFLYLIQALGPLSLELSRFLPITVIEVTLDLKGRLMRDFVPGRLKTLGPQAFPQLAAYLQGNLGGLAARAEDSARRGLPALVASALASAREVLGREHRRLTALAEMGNVSPREVELHAEKAERTLRALADAAVNLDAVRVLVLQEPKEPKE